MSHHADTLPDPSQDEALSVFLVEDALNIIAYSQPSPTAQPGIHFSEESVRWATAYLSRALREDRAIVKEALQADAKSLARSKIRLTAMRLTHFDDQLEEWIEPTREQVLREFADSFPHDVEHIPQSERRLRDWFHLAQLDHLKQPRGTALHHVWEDITSSA